MKTLPLIILSLLGCYQPDLSKVRYTCSPAFPLCPGGLECVNGVCGGEEPSADAAAILTDLAKTPPPDLVSDCSMCKSGRCAYMPNNSIGCYVVPNTPLSAQCQGAYRIAQMMPWTEANCAQTPGRWIGAVWQWGTATSAVTPPLTTWWSAQPKTGVTYRFIAACGISVDSAWSPMVNEWRRTVRCKSGQPGDAASDVSCPRGATPSDADWDLVTSSSPDTGVICVLR